MSEAPVSRMAVLFNYSTDWVRHEVEPTLKSTNSISQKALLVNLYQNIPSAVLSTINSGLYAPNNAWD